MLSALNDSVSPFCMYGNSSLHNRGLTLGLRAMLWESMQALTLYRCCCCLLLSTKAQSHSLPHAIKYCGGKQANAVTHQQVWARKAYINHCTFNLFSQYIPRNRSLGLSESGANSTSYYQTPHTKQQFHVLVFLTSLCWVDAQPLYFGRGLLGIMDNHCLDHREHLE